MYSKALLIASLSLLVAAGGSWNDGGNGDGDGWNNGNGDGWNNGNGGACNTSPMQCCKSVESSDSSDAARLLDSLGISTGGVTFPVGISCSPIGLAAIENGAQCDEDPVCCGDNSYNGIIALYCSTINAN